MNQETELQKTPLKNPLMAAFLSFLLPGAGHFYQGRNFKGIVNCVCVLTLLLWGLSMGKWGIVFRLEPTQENAQDVAQIQQRIRNGQRFANRELEPDRKKTKTHLGFFAQAPIGLVSIPAMIQEERYFSRDNVSATKDDIEVNSAAVGEFNYRSVDGEVSVKLLDGTIQMSPQQGEFGREMQGTFNGSDEQGNEFQLKLKGLNAIGPPIGSELYQPLRCFVSHLNGEPIDDGQLKAGIERAWADRVFVPPNVVALSHLHGQLGKKFPLAEVFTWIAGLLNVLVIWDAYAGPAYGYRMSRPEELKAEEEAQKEADKAETPSTDSSKSTP